MRSFPQLFSREALVRFQLCALENFVIFSVKPDWLRPFLLMNCVEAQPTFLFKKGRPSQRISKVVVLKYSLKELFWNISQISRKPSVVGCFCKVKIKKLYTPTDVFLRIFSNFSEQPFFSDDCFHRTKKNQKQLPGCFFKIALKYLRKLLGNYSREVLC